MHARGFLSLFALLASCFCLIPGSVKAESTAEAELSVQRGLVGLLKDLDNPLPDIPPVPPLPERTLGSIDRTVANSIGMKMVLVPAGEFLMGSRESPEELVTVFDAYEAKANKFAGENPQHRVRITRPFYLGMFELTVGQFRQFVADTAYQTDAEKDHKGGFGYDPQHGWRQKPEYTWRDAGFRQTDDHPVVNVSWNDAVAFCEWLGRKEGQTYRLPTEAEWEYACRAGTQTYYYNGNEPERLCEVGNVGDAALAKQFSDWVTISADDGYVFTAPTGRFQPNAFGLYDMHGNVFEWCADWYEESYYAASRVDDPAGLTMGTYRVLRGGSWLFKPTVHRSANRFRGVPDFRSGDVGFRVARSS